MMVQVNLCVAPPNTWHNSCISSATLNFLAINQSTNCKYNKILTLTWSYHQKIKTDTERINLGLVPVLHQCSLIFLYFISIHYPKYLPRYMN